jgi:hypothetical protein
VAGKQLADPDPGVGFTLKGLDKAGFEGFRSVGELLDPRLRHEIPDAPGVYIVLYTSDEPPEFLETSTGGWFKERDPTFEVDELEARWISRARVVYIGMTGEGRRAGLRTRIRALVRYGTGHNFGHAGGRALWQLPESGDLLVCWRPTEDGAEAASEERRLLDAFREQHKRLPFANAI